MVLAETLMPSRSSSTRSFSRPHLGYRSRSSLIRTTLATGVVGLRTCSGRRLLSSRPRICISAKERSQRETVSGLCPKWRAVRRRTRPCSSCHRITS